MFTTLAQGSELGVLVVRPMTEGSRADSSFHQALEGLSNSLSDEYEIRQLQVGKERDMAQLVDALEEFDPKVIILMDARAINLYKRYQVANSRADFPPAIMVMSLFVERETRVLQNTVGIEYQIPGVTSLVHLRSLLRRPIKRVGVLYRGETATYFHQQLTYCRGEDIDLVGIQLDEKRRNIRAKDIRRALKRLLADGVDAIWVLNDSAIINRETLRGWAPLLKSKVPVAVGIDAWVSNDRLIGHFAVVPDHYGLGEQTADLIETIREDDWQIRIHPFQLPISVKKILNQRKLDPALLKDLDRDNLLELDHILE